MSDSTVLDEATKGMEPARKSKSDFSAEYAASFLFALGGVRYREPPLRLAADHVRETTGSVDALPDDGIQPGKKAAMVEAFLNIQGDARLPDEAAKKAIRCMRDFGGLVKPEWIHLSETGKALRASASAERARRRLKRPPPSEADAPDAKKAATL